MGDIEATTDDIEATTDHCPQSIVIDKYLIKSDFLTFTVLVN